MTNMKIASEVKCTVVVVGDSRTGKTSLIQRFVNNTFHQTYTPTSFDKSFGSQEVNKHTVHFSFWDTSGSPAYDSVRPLSYQDADVFLLCYKISDPISLYNIKNKWIRELRSHRDDLPVVLCGCQADLRTDPATLSHLGKTGRTPVTTEQALAICCEISAVSYIETSARAPDEHLSNTTTSLAEAFELCALAAIKNKNSANCNNNNSSKAVKKTKQPPNKRYESSPTSDDNTFKRSPSINSTMSLFTDSSNLSYCASNNHNGGMGTFKRSPSTNSNLSLCANVRLVSSPQPQTLTVKRGYISAKENKNSPEESDYGFNDPRNIIQISGKLPPLQSPSFSECDSRLSTFSPEPLSDSGLPGPNRRRVPNVIPSRGMGKPPRRSTSGNCIALVGGLNTNNVNLTKPYYRHSAIVSTSEFEARIPPVISENEAYHNIYQSNFKTFTPKSSCSELSSVIIDENSKFSPSTIPLQPKNTEEIEDEVDSRTLTKMIAKDNDRVLNNTCDKYSAEKFPQQPIYDFGGGRKTVVKEERNMHYGKIENKPQRPTTLFKPSTSYYKTTVIPSEPTSSLSDQVYGFSNTASYITPTGDPQKRIWHQLKGRVPNSAHHRSSLMYVSGHQSNNYFNMDGAQHNTYKKNNQMFESNTELQTPLSSTGSSMGIFNGIPTEFSSADVVPTPISPDLVYASPSAAAGIPSEATSSCFGQIRPNCLSRRTSYRTNQKVSIPVASPMSPVDGNPLISSGRGSQCSFEIKSPSQQSVVSSNSSSSCCVSPFGNGNGMQSQVPRMMMRRYPTLPEDESCSENGSIQEIHSKEMQLSNNNHTGRIPLFEQPLKPYESLKSQISTSSQGSTGSKMTSSSATSDKSSISRNGIPLNGMIDCNRTLQLTENSSTRNYHPPHHHGNKALESSASRPLSIDTTVGDEHLQEETIKGLSFVSPKSGVYRPMPDGRKHRQNCIVM